MEFRILGPLEVRRNGEEIPLGGAKQRALLALLLLHANEAVSIDRLIDELWGESPPATAAHTVQVYVSNLRKALGDGRTIVTRPPGYLLRTGPEELDLGRFERLFAEARSLFDVDAEGAAARLRDALALWRGSPLADFSYQPFAQAAIARLEELRLTAVEERIEADLACGRHSELVGELEALTDQHPLRERLRGQLILALYRSGRQAEALEVFQETRRALVDELGIDPSPSLQRLERAILVQDPELEPVASAPARLRDSEAPDRSILLVAHDESSLQQLLALAGVLASSRSPHELILARLVPPAEQAELTGVAARLNDLGVALGREGVAARSVAFTSARMARDAIRLAETQAVDLAMLDADEALDSGGELAAETRSLLEAAPCDVALSFARATAGDAPVLVPFGGGEHDWAALELGAWFASARGVPVRLLGTSEPAGERDASLLLANASLALQQLVAVPSEPLLVPPGPENVLEAAAAAGLLVVGLADSWRQEGIGAARLAIVRGSAAPALLVRRGLRPGGLAPGATLTRFSWSVAAAAPA